MGIKSIGVAAAAAVVLLSGTAAARDLMVVGFGGPFQDNARTALFQGYAKATNQPVKDDVYNGEMAKVYSMVKSGDVTYDVIMVEAPELVRGCEDGVFEKMDWNVVKRDKFIPGGTTTCGAGAVLWGVTLFYDPAKVPNGPDTYAKLWDVKTYPGKRLLRSVAEDDARDRAARRRRRRLPTSTRCWRTPGGTEARVRQAGPDQAAASCGGSRARSPCSSIASGEATYAVGFTGRIVRANESGAKYPLLWKTLLYSVDYWAVVKGSPNAKEGMKMIEWMTDTKPLLALADIYAVSPANKEAAANPALSAKNPGMLSSATSPTGSSSTPSSGSRMARTWKQKFNAWVAK